MSLTAEKGVNGSVDLDSDSGRRLASISGGDHILRLDLWYPKMDGPLVRLEVGLMDVRAADSIRISYDYERDGWSIEQASRFEWDEDDRVCDSDWQEVAFIEAWAREVDEE